MMRCLTFAAITILAVALPAHAQGISLSELAPPRADNGPCPGNKTVLSRDETLVIRGAGTKQIELFGWFIDTVRTARIEGLPGASVRIDDTRGGPENVGAGCSGNGSIVLTLTLPKVSEVRRAKLKLNDYEKPVEIWPWAAGHDLVWRTDNAATGEEETDAERRGRYADFVRQKERDRDQCVLDNASNPNPRQLCAQLYPIPSIESVMPDRNTLRNQLFTRCAAPHGLKAEMYKNVMTITLPPDRQEIGRCASFPIVASHTNFAGPAPFYSQEVHLDLQGNPPFGQTQQGPLPNAYAFSAYQVPQPEIRWDIGLARNTVETFVGSVRQTYQRSGLEGSNTMVLILKSEPDYGVKAAIAPMINPNIGRMGSSIAVTVDPVEPTEAGQVFAWSLNGQNVTVGQCFRQTSGRMTPPSGTARFTLPLEVIEDSSCYGKTFSVTVGPQAQAANPVFARTATFVLSPPTQLRGDGKLTDDRLKIQGQIQGQSPLTRP